MLVRRHISKRGEQLPLAELKDTPFCAEFKTPSPSLPVSEQKSVAEPLLTRVGEGPERMT
jgi:hypothetical protein